MQTFKRILTLKPFSLATISRNYASVSVVDVNDNSKLKSWKEIPGPTNWPVIGQIPSFLSKPLSDMANFQVNLYKLYGPVVRLDSFLGRPPMLYLYDPETIAFILRSENWNPVRPGSNILEFYRKSYGTSKENSSKPGGLLIDHHEAWRSLRSAVNPVLMQSKTIELYRSSISDVADVMIKRIKSIRNENGTLNGDFTAEMNLWSLESIGVSALETRLNLFDPNVPEDAPERKLKDCIQNILKSSRELDFGPSLWKYYETEGFKKVMKVCEEKEKLTLHFIKKAKKNINIKPDEEKRILEKLLDIDEKIALIMACDMLLAGVDTTAGALTSTLYFLAINQDKQNKLREEVFSGDEPRRYLKACIKEALRILPVASANMRSSTKEYNVHGYRIPKNTIFVLNHQVICRSENQFPRAQEYIPERWTKEGPLSYKNAHPFAYSPFGFGARACIGRRLAEMEIETLLEKIVNNFRVEWSGPPTDSEIQSLATIKGPLCIAFKDL